MPAGPPEREGSSPPCEHQRGALTEHPLGTSLVVGCKDVMDSKVAS